MSLRVLVTSENELFFIKWLLWFSDSPSESNCILKDLAHFFHCCCGAAQVNRRHLYSKFFLLLF